MRLSRARVLNYRSIKDSGWFDVDATKTIFVGPNEGGKTAILRALEQLNPGRLVRPLDPLRDFPRSEYHLLQGGVVRPSELVVVQGIYEPDDDERAALAEISPIFASCLYSRTVHLDNSVTEQLLHAPEPPSVDLLGQYLRRIASYIDATRSAPGPAGTPGAPEQGAPPVSATEWLEGILAGIGDRELFVSDAEELASWMDTAIAPNVDRANVEQMTHLAELRETIGSVAARVRVIEELRRRLPVMVYVSTYPTVTPMLHLGHLADAIEAGAVDEFDQYNFGNLCLLNLLGFSARQLSDLGRAKEPEPGDLDGFERYRAQLDERDAALGTASLRLTNQVRQVWDPQLDTTGGQVPTRQDYVVRVTADQQYLKVTVEDSLGVQVELDQRSQGFRWLVSFFIVFFAQAAGRDRDAILLLDEPGLSLHGLKQREFRRTLSTLGTSNQLLFTTHSPFLIGTDELGLVRLVELVDRKEGTKVTADLAARDQASLLPLQEALAYDLASSLFASRKTLLLESLSDYWYLDATAKLLADAGMATLDSDIELVPVPALAKLAYFSTYLHAEGLKVAALLDDDAGGPGGEAQQALVAMLGDAHVLRTKDVYDGPVPAPHLQELLRETLVTVGREAGWDVADAAVSDWGTKEVDDIFSAVAGPELTSYRLAKEYARWTRDHRAADLTADERVLWMHLIENINRALA